MEAPNDKKHLTGKEGGPIDLDVAASWTKSHRDKHPDHPVSHFFGKEVLHKILAQEGCMGIRFYHGHNEKGEKHLIVVGATSDGNDQLTIAASDTIMTAHLILDQSMTCPGNPGCPNNPLTGR